jgi:molybdopterin molybdotransferase
MKGFKALLPVDNAISLVLDRFGDWIPGPEEVRLESGCGRVSAERVTSSVDIPPFDRSAVDGYAVRSEDTYSSSHSNPAELALKGTSEAGGAPPAGPLSRGECVEIFTGARVPDGADSVVMAEDCERLGGRVSVSKPVPRGANVSIKGEDIRTGDAILECGRVIRPWHIGVLASVGRNAVSVRRRPIIGIFSTGNELVGVGSAAGNDLSIIDSTRPMLASMASAAGCKVKDGGIVGDSSADISGNMLELASSSDAVVSIGGTSVGGKDLVPEAAKSISKEGVLFHGVAIKPGKPFGFGIVKGKPLFMLPGYPVSAMVGFEAIVLPLLRRWSGVGQAKRRVVKARMARRVPTTPGIRHYLRVRLEEAGRGLLASPITITGSGLLSSITRADGIVVIGEDYEGVEEGSEVNVELLED